MDEEPKFERIRYEIPQDAIARIVLARPDMANAQDYLMLSELNTALDHAARDPEIKVIIVAGEGKHFSSGHDVGNITPDMSAFPTVGTAANFDAPGVEGYMDREREVYFGYCKRWREIPKPTIAEVQGMAIAGGLMLAWPMDLIVCSEDATFIDPVSTLGTNGVEYFAHPYEFGLRTAKDMLFTGRRMGATEAFNRGMVQRVFPREQLTEETLALAAEIAKRPSITLAMTKRSVNNAQDAMGFHQTLEAAFTMHHLLHNHFLRVYDVIVPPGSFEGTREVLKRPEPAGLHPGELS
jgi:enoyl-CoA hydratase